MSAGAKSNEELFLEAAKSDDAFKQALKNKNSDELREQLNRIGIKVDDEEAMIEALKKVDWSNLAYLDHLISGRPISELN